MAGGRPKIFNTPNELQERLDEYKAYLETNGKPPTIAGLAYFTGLDRQSIYNYQKRDEFFDTLKQFRDWIIMNYEEQAFDKGNAGIIFLLKNYGYTDKQEHEVSGGLEVNVKWNE
jgi:hypothetical protein